jgi:hypothetical protein
VCYGTPTVPPFSHIDTMSTGFILSIPSQCHDTLLSILLNILWDIF